MTRRSNGAFLLVCGIVGASVSAPVAAQAATGPAVEVLDGATRVDGVAAQKVDEGQPLTVHWTGYSPGTPVVISLCATPTRVKTDWQATTWLFLRYCAHQTRLIAQTGADGSGTATFTAHQGAYASVPIFYNGSSYNGNESLTCNSFNKCAITVSECEWDQPLTMKQQGSVWTLAPATPATGVPDPAVAAVSGDISYSNLVYPKTPPTPPLTAPFTKAIPAPALPAFPESPTPPELTPITGTPVGEPIIGAGSADFVSVFDTWLQNVRRLAQPADVDFIRGTSVFGAAQLNAGFTSNFTAGADYAVVGGSGLTKTDFGGDVSYAPVALTGLGVANSVQYGGLGLNTLRFSPQSLALMLGAGDGVNSGDWGDSLTHSPTSADNHGCGLPLQTTLQILRSGDNEQSQVLSQWFAATVDPTEFGKIFSSDPGSASLIPNRHSATIRSAENGATSAYTIATDAGDALPKNPDDPSTVTAATLARLSKGALGYTDVTEAGAAHAKALPLPLSPLKNAAGKYVLPTADSILAGYGLMTKNSDGTLSPTFTHTEAAGAYPLPMVYYIAVPKADASGKNPLPIGKRKTLASLIQYAVGDDAQKAVTDLGGAALPDDLRTQAKDVATMLLKADPATTPTPTPSATTSGSGSSGSGSGSGSGTGTGTTSPTGTTPVSAPTLTASPSPSAGVSLPVVTAGPAALKNDTVRGGRVPSPSWSLSLTVLCVLGGVVVLAGGAWRVVLARRNRAGS